MQHVTLPSEVFTDETGDPPILVVYITFEGKAEIVQWDSNSRAWERYTLSQLI